MRRSRARAGARAMARVWRDWMDVGEKKKEKSKERERKAKSASTFLG